MSVELFGPKGYEYQYLVAIYACLNILSQKINVRELIIEPLAGEDFIIQYNTDDGLRHLEIQTKRESSALDVGKFVQWCCHFRRDNKKVITPLSQLIDNKASNFLIVTTARCVDAISGFKEKAGTITRVPRSIPMLTKNAVLQQVTELISTLNKDDAHSFEASHVQTVFQKLKDRTQFKNTFNKVLIWEEQSEDKLEYECKRLLNQHFLIAQSQADAVLSALEKVIKHSRDHRSDCYGEFMQVLRSRRSNAPVLQTFHVAHPKEKELIAALTEQSGVFLRGNSFCGKSTMGVYLSNVLFNKGFRYQQTSDVQEAGRFLHSAAAEERVCFLDDPLGHEYSSQSDILYKQVADLASSLQPNCKLIVTANNEVLKHFDMRLYPFSWHDLTINDTATALHLWQKIAKHKGVPKKVQDDIARHIQSLTPDSLLQPGQMDYLTTHYKQIKNWDKRAISLFAAIDASRIEKMIKKLGRDQVRAAQVLALLSTTIVGVTTKDLEYVFDGTAVFPGLLSEKSGWVGTYLFNRSEEKPVFPKYTTSSEPNANLAAGLDDLEANGFISFENQQYRFRHPVYALAAQKLLLDLPENRFKDLLQLFTKCLSVLHPQNAIIAAQHLFTLFENQETDQRREAIIALGKTATRSIFPSVQDAATVFLIAVYSHLDEATREQLNFKLSSHNSISSKMFWHGGIPYISEKDTGISNAYFRYQKLPGDEEFNELVEKMRDTDAALLSPFQAWKMCNYLKLKSLKQPVAVPLIIISKLLLYSEAFIREMAAFHLMYAFAKPPVELIEQVFSDAYPGVVVEAFRGSIRGGKNTDPQIYPLIKEKQEASLMRSGVKVAIQNFMVQFGVGYSHYTFDWREHVAEEDQQPMWQRWAELMPIFLENTDDEVRFSEHRFIQTLQYSIPYIGVSQKQHLTVALLDWLQRLEKGFNASSTLYYITDYYLDFAEQLSVPARMDMLVRLFSIDSTYFESYNFNQFASHWNVLVEEEKKFIRDRLAQANTEMHGVVLGFDELPPEIIKLLTGHDNFFQLNPEESIKLLPVDVLTSALAARFGSNYYRDLHFGPSKEWKAILKYLATTTDHPLRIYAMAIILQDLFLRDSIEEAMVEMDILISWLKSEEELVQQSIRYTFVEHLISYTYSKMEPFWRLFLENAPADQIAATKKLMLDYLPPISNYDNEYVLRGFENPEIAMMASEYFVREVAKVLLEFTNASLYHKSVDIFNKEAKNDFKLASTFDILQLLFKKYNDEKSELAEFVEERRKQFINRASKLRNDFKLIYQQFLEASAPHTTIGR